ncbi:MAG: ribonuclease E/G, partial [Myxococcota bacterium]|nr:ribonuclease E/G [Myxococcota bacterium]
DDKNLFKSVQSFMEDFMPQLRDRVQLYRSLEPIFDTFGIETEIHRALGRKVWLKSGGYLIIDQTEALTAIDVNSGKFVGRSSLEDTTLAINLEAAQEVVHQLRLRNIGGIIVVDFIDMERAANRDRVNQSLESALRADRARTNVLKISDLGLVEMTRKRVQENLTQFLSDGCSYCDGTGSTRSRTTVTYDILREVRREASRDRASEHVYVNTHPTVADLMYGEELKSLENIERAIKKRVVVRAVGHYHLERYEVYSQ